eukprot:Skav212558  [mRNA]  locus=scaffold2158:81718:82995:+ [translate_table: standard]
MQDWFSFPLYLTEAVWAKVRAEERSLAKIDAVIKHLTELGLRHPSERTLAVVCSLVAHCSSEPLSQDVSRQTALLSTVKSVARTNVTRAKQLGVPLPAGYLTVLPRNTAEAPPGIQALFANGFTVPPVPLEPIWEQAIQWPLRDTHASVRLARQVSQPLTASAAACPVTVAQQAVLQTAQLMMNSFAGTWNRSDSDGAAVQLTPLGRAIAGGAREPAGSRTGHTLPALLDRASAPVPALLDGPSAAEPVDIAPTVSPQSVGPAANTALEPAATVAAPVASVSPQSEGTQALTNTAATPEPEIALAASVERLAEAHYNEDLGGTGEDLRKKPAGALKKPSASPGVAQKCTQGQPLKKPAASRVAGTMKRPAGHNVKHAVLKRPAAAAGDLTRAEAARLRPNGCGKCRNQVGCTPSCWRLRGRNLID